jgi:hypothetical protein
MRITTQVKNFKCDNISPVVLLLLASSTISLPANLQVIIHLMTVNKVWHRWQATLYLVSDHSLASSLPLCVHIDTSVFVIPSFFSSLHLLFIMIPFDNNKHTTLPRCSCYSFLSSRFCPPPPTHNQLCMGLEFMANWYVPKK